MLYISTMVVEIVVVVRGLGGPGRSGALTRQSGPNYPPAVYSQFKYSIKFLQESLNSIGLQETNGRRFEPIKEEGEETDYDGIGPNTNQTFTTEVYF